MYVDTEAGLGWAKGIERGIERSTVISNKKQMGLFIFRKVSCGLDEWDQRSEMLGGLKEGMLQIIRFGYIVIDRECMVPT